MPELSEVAIEFWADFWLLSTLAAHMAHWARACGADKNPVAIMPSKSL